jgi:hypothetical protein
MVRLEQAQGEEGAVQQENRCRELFPAPENELPPAKGNMFKHLNTLINHLLTISA